MTIRDYRQARDLLADAFEAHEKGNTQEVMERLSFVASKLGLKPLGGWVGVDNVTAPQEDLASQNAKLRAVNDRLQAELNQAKLDRQAAEKRMRQVGTETAQLRRGDQQKIERALARVGELADISRRVREASVTYHDQLDLLLSLTRELRTLMDGGI